jgi:hypothetical protein
VLTAAFATSLAACLPPEPSAARLSCFHGCANRKDDCIMQATTAAAMQACDRASASCGARCPE